jgi:hypothetical protein
MKTGSDLPVIVSFYFNQVSFSWAQIRNLPTGY